jgi:hypothetical protein
MLITRFLVAGAGPDIMTPIMSPIRRFRSRLVTPRFSGLAALSLALFMLMASGTLAQTDITEKVRRNTPLSKMIQDFCASHCQGNQSEGYLTSVVLQPIGGNRYRGYLIADLRNWQEMDEPLNVTVFDWTVRIRAEGVLDATTCTAVVNSVTVDNDIYGMISGLLDEHKGQKHTVPNYKRILP